MWSELVGRRGDYLVYRMRRWDTSGSANDYIYWEIYSPITTTGSCGAKNLEETNYGRV